MVMTLNVGCESFRRSLGAFSSRRGARPSLLSEVNPPTGEPDAGDPPVRFGGRGEPGPLGPPYPYLFLFVFDENSPPRRAYRRADRSA